MSGPNASNPEHLTPAPLFPLLKPFVPKMVQVLEEVVFGDIWQRPGLSRRDRSLITCAALVAMNRSFQLRAHLRIARTHGVTEAEMGEVITHLAMYCGMPAAVAAAVMGNDAYEVEGGGLEASLKQSL
jgi:4-carboxymuconolactone decarboxylase